MNDTWYSLAVGVALLDYALLVLVATVFAISFRSLRNDFRWVAGLMWFALAIETVAKLYLFQWIEGSNHYLLHVYTPGEFWLLALCYRELLHLSQHHRKHYTWAIIATGIAITAYAMVALGYPEAIGFKAAQWYNKVMVNCSMMVLSVWLFIRIIREPSQFPAHSSAIITLNSAILLYYAATFMVFVALELLLTESFEQGISLWLSFSVLALVLHALLLISLWQNRLAK